mmetsp:Transcript_23194/g.64716  ORF Transcript_23194/g.64716 Transcript_23194/m.64716 type:complete len:293 (+) Transcript_23194:420-1298(+)
MIPFSPIYGAYGQSYWYEYSWCQSKTIGVVFEGGSLGDAQTIEGGDCALLILGTGREETGHDAAIRRGWAFEGVLYGGMLIEQRVIHVLVHVADAHHRPIQRVPIDHFVILGVRWVRRGLDDVAAAMLRHAMHTDACAKTIPGLRGPVAEAVRGDAGQARDTIDDLDARLDPVLVVQTQEDPDLIKLTIRFDGEAGCDRDREVCLRYDGVKEWAIVFYEQRLVIRLPPEVLLSRRANLQLVSNLHRNELPPSIPSLSLRLRILGGVIRIGLGRPSIGWAVPLQQRPITSSRS